MSVDPRDLLRRLDAVEPFPRAVVVEMLHRLQLDEHANIDDLGPPDGIAAQKARAIFADILEMRRRSGGWC